MSFRAGLRLPEVRRDEPDDAVVDGGRLVVRLRAPVSASDIAQLCAQAREVLGTGTAFAVVCQVHDPVDLSVVDAVARLQLTALRLGRQVRLSSAGTGAAGTRAAELLGLCGMTDVVPPSSEPVGQAEAGEQRGVQEVVDVPHLPL